MKKPISFLVDLALRVTRPMAWSVLPAMLAVMVAAGSGCDGDSYSKAIKYAVRTDPLVLIKADLGDERIEPDRPGVLPLLSAKDVQEPFNPMFAKGDSLFKKENLRDPALIPRADRNLIEEVLQEFFGTPASPRVLVSPDIVKTLRLEDVHLEHGSSLYRLHCLHCHGVTGDGRGPTGRWVNPHPRDYRQGVFKFMSVDQTAGPQPPRRDDLQRVLQQGVEGTAMPSFGVQLAPADLEDLVSYVIHLSLRGKVEFDVIKEGFDYDREKNTLTAKDPSDIGALDVLMSNKLANNAKAWSDSQSKDKAINVFAYPYDDRAAKDNNLTQLEYSILRGFYLFKGEESAKLGLSKEDAKAANCISCHTSYGRQSPYKFDDWGTLTKARDLTQGIFRGGHRPVDIYFRIHSGISGSGMNSFGTVIAKKENIWDLVNFVQTLPYTAMRNKLGMQLD
ncbi:MAG TPA: cytochrome c [Gemmataceae bacterium]|nr:cytochrome c [Gemmataceae bacterium]